MSDNKFDFIVIGGGMAGMAAAIYAKRFGMNVAIVSQEFGGLIATTHLVENYPGFPSISGRGLADELKKHVESLEIPKVMSKVIDIKKEGEENPIYNIECQNKETYSTPSVLIATGSEHRKLKIPGEKEYYGKGVSYCGTCDGPFFKDKIVAVIGGSDSAAKEAMYLSGIAKEVKLIYRKDKLRAEPINVKRVKDKENIEIIYNTNVIEMLGNETKLTGAKLDTGNDLDLDGIFIKIGYIPQTDLAENLGVELNEQGEIIVDKHGKTNLPGIYAAGDVINEKFKQAITSAAGGVYAANEAHQYVQSLNS